MTAQKPESERHLPLKQNKQTNIKQKTPRQKYKTETRTVYADKLSLKHLELRTFFRFHGWIDRYDLLLLYYFRS